MSYIADLTLVHYTDLADFGGNTIKFEVQDEVNFEKAFYAAIVEFLKTEDGKKAVKEVHGNFGAGDAIDYVPKKLWKKHGIKILPNRAKEHLVLVSDEILSAVDDME